MGGTHEGKVAASAAPPRCDDLAAYPAGLGEAQQERNTEHSDADFGRHAERLDDAQVRLENRGDCRAAHLWGNKAASCTHPHDYVVGRHRQRR